MADAAPNRMISGTAFAINGGKSSVTVEQLRDDFTNKGSK
jgi:hypothetical protein